ncbi:MAG: hypothetical protein PWR21_222 [Methanoculleus sp.]|nr:hypothetical protein [Methanoculleus sp.]MDK2990745.1 hypothetical protein [Methanoculleus sp.]
MMKFSETIRRRLGWCPNAAAAGTCRRRYAAPGGEVGIEAVAGDGREMMEDIFVEYVSPRFILLMPFAFLGFLMLFVVSLLIPSLWPGLIFTFMAIFFIAWAAWRIYFDPYRTVIEFSGNSVIVRRLRTRPLVFGKDAVRSVEVKDADRPVPRWVSVPLWLLMVAVVSFNLVGKELIRYLGSQAFDPYFGFQVLLAVGWMVFMLEWLYRVLASLRYPGYLRMTLVPAGFLHIYTDGPERVAALLGSPR